MCLIEGNRPTTIQFHKWHRAVERPPGEREQKTRAGKSEWHDTGSEAAPVWDYLAVVGIPRANYQNGQHDIWSSNYKQPGSQETSADSCHWTLFSPSTFRVGTEGPPRNDDPKPSPKVIGTLNQFWSSRLSTGIGCQTESIKALVLTI